MKNQTLLLLTLALPTLLASCAEAPESGADIPAATPSALSAVPEFLYDPDWPDTPLPNGWILGEVGGVDVDAEGHVWVIHRPWTVSGRELGAVVGAAECCRPAPPVIEFDASGNVVQAWPELTEFFAEPGTAAGQGNPVGPQGETLWEAADGTGYGEWGRREHTVYVDHNDFVWITLDEAHVIYKFTRNGEHRLTIGEKWETGGSNDVTRLGRPAGLVVDPDANELFVADGYTNKRIIVFDAETGDYHRHWGAYGNRPEDIQLEFDPDSEPPQQFVGPVHGIDLSNDGLVYVSDRRANRVQVFERDGTFVQEGFVSPETRDLGTAYGVALSKDPEQRWAFVNDGSNNKIWILRRSDLEVVGSFASYGRQGGQVLSAHSIAVDSEGNIYVGETRGRRVQRFSLQGEGEALATAEVVGLDLPLVVMMDSRHPARVYDEETVAANRTNADVLHDILRDLPIVGRTETIGPEWTRDEQVVALDPDLVIIHYSGFREEDGGGPRERLKRFIRHFGETDTRLLIYSRAPEAALQQTVVELLHDAVAPSSDLLDRVDVFGLDDHGPRSWRSPETANALKLRVQGILGV